MVGTFATAGRHGGGRALLLGLDWTTAWILGAALAPTDPAVMFSVLGNREVRGRTGTILEGESGVNDPVGIALMIGMIELATAGRADGVGVVSRSSSSRWRSGSSSASSARLRSSPDAPNVSLPSAGSIRSGCSPAAGVIYGAASVLHGSGFLAVFVAGLLIGDERVPYKRPRSSASTRRSASLAEIAVFVALGLTIDVTQLVDAGRVARGLVLVLVLAFVVRPLVVAPLLLRRGCAAARALRRCGAA